VERADLLSRPVRRIASDHRRAPVLIAYVDADQLLPLHIAPTRSGSLIPIRSLGRSAATGGVRWMLRRGLHRPGPGRRGACPSSGACAPGSGTGSAPSRSSFVPNLGHDGVVRGFLRHDSDVSEQKNAEAQIAN